MIVASARDVDAAAANVAFVRQVVGVLFIFW
jgi:hypothetical protein